MIEARDVIKRYGSFLAVDGISFDVPTGVVAGFLGQNGAGKTTTLRMVSCYMPPTRGAIRVGGFDTVRDSEEVRRRIGYLPERVPLYDEMRVDDYLRFRARIKGLRGGAVKGATDRVIGRMTLEPKRGKPIGTLSKGLRQRVGLADALIHDPALLVLDEPTSGLDPDQRIEVRKLVSELKGDRTVLLSTHILPEAEAVCDHVIIIHRGRLRAAERLIDLRSKSRIVSVRHAGPPLASYAPVAAVGVHGSPGGPTTVTVDEDEAGSAIVAMAVLAGRAVLEMSTAMASLESIFLRITSTGEEPR